MITITFTGETVPEVMGRMLAFVASTTLASPPEGPGIEVPSAPKKRGRPPKATLDPEKALKEYDFVMEQRRLVEEETVEAPPIEAVSEEEADEVGQTEAPPSDAIANEKVKQEVIAQLSDLFTAGKVKTLRHILDTYGKGAKSFPEIDASAFPAIKEALSKGEAA